MADIELVIKVPEEEYRWIMKSEKTVFADVASKECMLHAIKNGTPLPKGHGRLIDIGKIDEDRIDSDNPVISLTIGGEYIEAVSLDYLNNLPTIIEADNEGE